MRFDRFFARKYFNIFLTASHYFKETKALSTFKQLEGIEPVLMSYKIYDERINSKNTTPLMIMHGLFGSKSNWNSISKALNQHLARKIITVDARNHGESPHTNEFSYFHLAKDIQHLISSLNLSTVHLMGHSMGGRAAMLFSLLYPDYVERLIVVDISPFYRSAKMRGMAEYFVAMKHVDVEGVKTLSEARKLADKQLIPWIPEVEVRQFLLTNLVNAEKGYKWRINLDALEKAFHENIMEFPIVPSKFDKPVLFIIGDRSDYIRPYEHEKILQIFPKAVFDNLDAGHWVHAEKPEDFIKIIKIFYRLKKYVKLAEYWEWYYDMREGR